MNNVIVKSGLMLVFIIILILLTYAVYEYVQYQQGMHNDRDMTRRTIKDFDSKYKSFIKMLKAIIAQNKDNQIKISQLSSEDTYISEQIKEKDQVIQAKIAKLQESLAQHGGEIETLERQFDKLGNKIQKSKEIQALIKTMRQSNNQLFADLVMTSRQVTDTSSALWNALTQVFNRYLKTNDNIKDLQKKTVANNKTKIDLVQKRLEFRGLMSQYIAEISDINRDIRDLNFSVGTQHDRFQDLTQLVNANRISIEALYENYENNKNDIEQLNAQLNEANILRDQMSDRLNAIRDAYTANDDIDVGDTLMDIRAFLDELQIFIDVCRGAIEIIESANVIILQDINTLQNRINAINSRIDLLENKYDFIDTRIAELNTSNAYIENSLNEISQMHDDSSDDLTSLSDKYAILNTEIASMQQDLNVNDTYIDNIDENMRALFNFRQNGNVITNDLQDQQFNTNDISAFDFRTHATATNGMTISTGNAINDNRNLRVCKKESDNICLHFGIGDNGFNIMPQNVHHFIINDKNNNGLARFDMKNNAIFMGGVDESAALILHNNTAYARVEGNVVAPPPVVAPPAPMLPPGCRLVDDILKIATSIYHIAFLTKRGHVFTMGKNAAGVLGLGFSNMSWSSGHEHVITSPQQITRLNDGSPFPKIIDITSGTMAWYLTNTNQLIFTGGPITNGGASLPRQYNKISFKISNIFCGKEFIIGSVTPPSVGKKTFLVFTKKDTNELYRMDETVNLSEFPNGETIMAPLKIEGTNQVLKNVIGFSCNEDANIYLTTDKTVFIDKEAGYDTYRKQENFNPTVKQSDLPQITRILGDAWVIGTNNTLYSGQGGVWNNFFIEVNDIINISRIYSSDTFHLLTKQGKLFTDGYKGNWTEQIYFQNNSKKFDNMLVSQFWRAYGFLNDTAIITVLTTDSGEVYTIDKVNAINQLTFPFPPIEANEQNEENLKKYCPPVVAEFPETKISKLSSFSINSTHSIAYISNDKKMYMGRMDPVTLSRVYRKVGKQGRLNGAWVTFKGKPYTNVKMTWGQNAWTCILTYNGKLIMRNNTNEYTNLNVYIDSSNKENNISQFFINESNNICIITTNNVLYKGITLGFTYPNAVKRYENVKHMTFNRNRTVNLYNDITILHTDGSITGNLFQRSATQLPKPKEVFYNSVYDKIIWLSEEGDVYHNNDIDTIIGNHLGLGKKVFKITTMSDFVITCFLLFNGDIYIMGSQYEFNSNIPIKIPANPAKDILCIHDEIKVLLQNGNIVTISFRGVDGKNPKYVVSDEITIELSEDMDVPYW